jgi:hypothetical protein
VQLINNQYIIIFLSCTKDENSLSIVKKTDKTNSNGIISFIVPGKTDGESYIFSYALSKDEATIKNKYAYRIPSTKNYGGHKSMIIKFDKNYQQKFEGGGVQLMIFPKDGTKVTQ